MSDFGSVMSVKSCRKPYVCVVCERKIPAGNPWEGYRGMWENEFQTWKACSSCVENIFPRIEPGEEIGFEDFESFLEEQAYLPNNRASWNWSEDKQSIVLTWKNGEVKTIPYPYNPKQIAIGK